VSEYRDALRTVERMRNRKASANIFPTTPAIGHMPFEGHRPLSEIGNHDDKADCKARNERLAA